MQDIRADVLHFLEWRRRQALTAIARTGEMALGVAEADPEPLDDVLIDDEVVDPHEALR